VGEKEEDWRLTENALRWDRKQMARKNARLSFVQSPVFVGHPKSEIAGSEMTGSD
jgi:hypothetical protein